MATKYKTNIEITSEAANKDEAMQIMEDYLSGNIMSGIDMKCTTRQVHFYDNTAAKITAVLLLTAISFLSGITTTPNYKLSSGICQTAAVQLPLKTADANRDTKAFREEWEQKQTKAALEIH